MIDTHERHAELLGTIGEVVDQALVVESLQRQHLGADASASVSTPSAAFPFIR